MEENLNSVQTENQSIELTPTVKQDIVCSAKWGKFLAILCFVSAGIILIIAILSLCVGSISSELIENNGGSELLADSKEMTGAITAVIYIIAAIVCVVIGWFLFKATKNIEKGINTDNQDTIAIGLHNLKTFCQVYGVITVIGLVISFLTIIGGLIVLAFVSTI